MKWSVALFGHYKPRFYLRERATGNLVTDFVDKPTEAYWDEEKYYVYDVQGWEYRAQPGDIIAIKPFDKRHTWTDVEKKLFLIVPMSGFELEHHAGLVEPNWDTNSYPVLPKEAIQKLIQANRSEELHPQRYHNKRRFNIPLTDLEAMGVDTAKMLDKRLLYAPKLDTITTLQCYDKVKKAKVDASAKFRPLAPMKIGKL